MKESERLIGIFGKLGIIVLLLLGLSVINNYFLHDDMLYHEIGLMAFIFVISLIIILLKICKAWEQERKEKIEEYDSILKERYDNLSCYDERNFKVATNQDENILCNNRNIETDYVISGTLYSKPITYANNIYISHVTHDSEGSHRTYYFKGELYIIRDNDLLYDVNIANYPAGERDCKHKKYNFKYHILNNQVLYSKTELTKTDIQKIDKKLTSIINILSNYFITDKITFIINKGQINIYIPKYSKIEEEDIKTDKDKFIKFVKYDKGDDLDFNLKIIEILLKIK